MRYIDLHCDTLSELYHRKVEGIPYAGFEGRTSEAERKAFASESLLRNGLCIDIEKMKTGHTLLQAFACYVNLNRQGGADGAWDYVMKLLDFYEKEADAVGSARETGGCSKKRTQPGLKLCLTGRDLTGRNFTGRNFTGRNFTGRNFTDKNFTDRNLTDRKPAGLDFNDDEVCEERNIYVMLTVEEGGVLNNDLQRLDLLYDRGIRLITLTWNFENCLGFPNSADASVMGQGLKPFGRTVVEKMNERKMIVDVSHLSDGGFYDVADMMKSAGRRFVASHSCARALCPHPRNLTDDMLKVLGNAGGVAGVNYYGHFLNKEGISDVASVIAHIRYMVNKAGMDAVALGSDFDGFGGGSELATAGEMPLLFDAMAKAGFTQDEIEKIAWKNAFDLIKTSI